MDCFIHLIKRAILVLSFFLYLFNNLSCKKLVQISPPASSITTSQVFSTDEEATSAMAGVYAKMINSSPAPNCFSGGITIYCGASADELMYFSQTNTFNSQFQKNELLSNNIYINGIFWSAAYFILYESNSVIEGLQTTTSPIHDSVKNELIGEAEFIRALCNFYLVNLFGNVPLVNTTNWHNTNLLTRAPVSQVYSSIISDLQDAQNRLQSDYSVGNGERIVPNKWAATALLARVYLYTGDYADAYTQASAVINNPLYSLSPLTGSAGVFSMNSPEAIFQLQQSNTTSPYNATPEGNQIIPISATAQPYVYLTPQLLNAFDSGDQRKTAWLNHTTYAGNTYYYPYKYKIGPGQKAVNGPYTEYYMVLRLGEQYLIRAEAEANGAGGGSSDAVANLNFIRNRAGLSNYTGATDKTSLLNAIYHERQVELFCEWGNRWFDLIRSGQAHNSLDSISYKQPWSDNSLLYPVPYSELALDPNLTQNPGY